MIRPGYRGGVTTSTRDAAGTTRAAPGARDAVFAQLADAGRAEQVARRLADAIVLGVLVPGERLPSEAELARRFGVALVTAREGLGILREAGLVETRRGRDGGSFVIESPAPHAALVRSRRRAPVARPNGPPQPTTNACATGSTPQTSAARPKRAGTPAGSSSSSPF